MRDFIVGTLGAILFFGILYLPFDGELKNLMAGIACLLVLAYYIVKTILVRGGIDWKRVIVITFPTIVLVVTLIFNMTYQVGIGWLYLWGGYAILTAVALKIAARVSQVR